MLPALNKDDLAEPGGSGQGWESSWGKQEGTNSLPQPRCWYQGQNQGKACSYSTSDLCVMENNQLGLVRNKSLQIRDFFGL